MLARQKQLVDSCWPKKAPIVDSLLASLQQRAALACSGFPVLPCQGCTAIFLHDASLVLAISVAKFRHQVRRKKPQRDAVVCEAQVPHSGHVRVWIQSADNDALDAPPKDVLKTIGVPYGAVVAWLKGSD